MQIREAISTGPLQIPELVRLLQTQGANLMTAPLARLARGTPVYVEADADLLRVQRRMAEALVRLVPVLDGSKLLGLVDLVDLARVSDQLIRLATARQTFSTKMSTQITRTSP